MINPNSMSIQDIEILQTIYCDGCCQSCENCIKEFVRDLWYYIEKYNKEHDE